MVESDWCGGRSSRSSWGEFCLSKSSSNKPSNLSDHSLVWPSTLQSPSCASRPPSPLFGSSCSAKTNVSDERAGGESFLFGLDASLQSAKCFRPSDTKKPRDAIKNPFSIEVIVKEINNEFKHMRGEPVYTFGRGPTPGLEAIRDAVQRNTKELIDDLNSMKADADAQKTQKDSALKKIKEEVASSRSKCLRCRIENLENLCCEYGTLSRK